MHKTREYISQSACLASTEVLPSQVPQYHLFQGRLCLPSEFYEIQALMTHFLDKYHCPYNGFS